jgi:hypothetical protein
MSIILPISYSKTPENKAEPTKCPLPVIGNASSGEWNVVKLLLGRLVSPSLRLTCRLLTPRSGSRLGLEIEPSLVRLKPGREDPYRWVVADSIRKIFKTNLSTASVADCQKICEALKSDIEIIKAVSPHAVQDEEELFEVPTPWRCRFTGPNIFLLGPTSCYVTRQ